MTRASERARGRGERARAREEGKADREDEISSPPLACRGRSCWMDMVMEGGREGEADG